MEKKPTTNVTKLQLPEETRFYKPFFHSFTFVKKKCNVNGSEDIKNCPIFQKVAKTVSKLKKYQNIYIKTQFESLKHLQQTTFETLKYLQQIIF